MQALAGIALDNASVAAWDAVVKSCPGLNVAKDRAYGAFSEAIAKSEMLKYLSTHPQKVDAVFEVATMAPGVMRAFQQSGRPMPIVPDIGLSKASLGYWKQNDAKYDNSATSLPPVPAGRAVADVARRMLAGQGVKINTLVGEQPIVTDATLADWVEGAWSLNTPGSAPGAADSFLPPKFLDGFFLKPAALD